MSGSPPDPNRRAHIRTMLRAAPDGTPRLMAVVNCTPDSFHAPSRAMHDVAVQAALDAWDQGATWVDLGGESTRPGASPVSEIEELERVLPVIVELRERSDGLISIDTSKPEVARRCVQAGADLVNDVSGLRDPEMLAFITDGRVPVCIMHMQGTPATMQVDPTYTSVSDEVRSALHATASTLVEGGHDPDLIALDPGIGFGKRLEDNLVLLRTDLSDGRRFPVLWGVSRKSMIAHLTGRDATEDRLHGTLGVAAHARTSGIDLLRVHDVAPHMDLLRVLNAIEDAVC